MDVDKIIRVNAEDLNKACVLFQELTKSIINKEKFLILVEKETEARCVKFTYMSGSDVPEQNNQRNFEVEFELAPMMSFPEFKEVLQKMEAQLKQEFEMEE